MRLLFDENLAERLVKDLEDLYPESSHVRALSLAGAGDQEIWARAGAGGFVLVTKDEDFHRYSVLVGPPPKVIWLRLGSSAKPKTDQVEDLEATKTFFLEFGMELEGQAFVQGRWVDLVVGLERHCR